VTEPLPPVSLEPKPEEDAEAPVGFVARYAVMQRAGGVATALITALLAFAIGGLVVLATGHNPLDAYREIFNGTGLNWFFPWVTGDERTTAALNLQQTLIYWVPLVLCGFAVAFAVHVLLMGRPARGASGH